jgi:membrane protein
VTSTTDTIAAVVAVAREQQITVDAASLAFYAFNSFVALVVLAYASFTAFGTGTILAVILETLTGVGAVEFQRAFERVGRNTAGRRRAVVLALAISAWSSLRLFRAIESVFANVYGARKERSLFRHLVDSVLVLVAVTATIVVMAIAGSFFLFRIGTLWTTFGSVVLWLGLVLLFFPIYYTFSGPDATAREVLPGAVFAAAGWIVSAIGLRIYVQLSGSVDLYGVVGAVLLVLTWLYVVALSLVAGVVVNAVLADRIEADSDWYVLGG